MIWVGIVLFTGNRKMYISERVEWCTENVHAIFFIICPKVQYWTPFAPGWISRRSSDFILLPKTIDAGHKLMKSDRHVKWDSGNLGHYYCWTVGHLLWTWLFCLTEMQRLLCNVESVWSTAMRVVESQFLSHGCLSLSKHISGIYVLSYGN